MACAPCAAAALDRQEATRRRLEQESGPVDSWVVGAVTFVGPGSESEARAYGRRIGITPTFVPADPA